jgi:hypothetical protein
MPYIKAKDRLSFDSCLSNISNGINGVGELNYCITKLCNNYVYDREKNYDHINRVIGVLECAKQEFYRRIASPYEDKKNLINGDVYDM